MKIAILADTHDNIWKLDAALAEMEEARLLIHCGDLCSPFMIQHLGEGAQGRPCHVVWGNNDGDILLICRVAAKYPGIELHGPLAELSVHGCRIAVNHYPAIAQSLAASGNYDLVCYGHDHTAHSELVGTTRLLNPGELMGMKGTPTFAWFDTETREVRFQQVG